MIISSIWAYAFVVPRAFDAWQEFRIGKDRTVTTGGKGRGFKMSSDIHTKSMDRKDGNAKAWRCFFPKGAIMKYWWVLIAVVCLPVATQAEQGDPQTVEQCEAMNETLQALTVRLVTEGVQCQQDIRTNRAAVVDLTPCGLCCESVHGKPGEDPLNPGSLHNCLFPQTCAANREQQYCALSKWMNIRKFCQNHVAS